MMVWAYASGVHSYPERLALQISKQETTLSICCGVLGGGTAWFLITIWNREGKVLTRQFTKGGKRNVFRLAPEAYTVQVKNYSNLNPGAVTKWTRLEAGTCLTLRLLFSQPLCLPRVVPVSFTVSDANYPGITALNGGIIIWQQPITP